MKIQKIFDEEGSLHKTTQYEQIDEKPKLNK